MRPTARRGGCAIHRGWERDVADIATPADLARTSMPTRAAAAATAVRAGSGALPALASVAIDGWRTLARKTCEPNGFYLPDWALAIDASARGRTGMTALTAWRDTPGQPRL